MVHKLTIKIDGKVVYVRTPAGIASGSLRISARGRWTDLPIALQEAGKGQARAIRKALRAAGLTKLAQTPCGELLGVAAAGQ